MNKKCVGCGIDFSPKWKKAIYCSIRCSKIGDRNPAWKGGVFNLICATCEKVFISDSHLNRERKFCSQKCAKSGNNNSQWKGDTVGYTGLHNWVYRNSEKPSKCEGCGKERKLDAANISGEYKRDISDWEWLCRKCHMDKDGRLEKLIIRNKRKV